MIEQYFQGTPFEPRLDKYTPELIADTPNGVTGFISWRIDQHTQGVCWTTDPNKGLHFADRESAELMCAEMPEYWDVRIVEHGWMDFPPTSAAKVPVT